MKIVFPMAGRGSRFLAVADQNPDYRGLKPLIKIKGEPMIHWALKSLSFINFPNRPTKTKFKVQPKDLIFICLEQHQKEHGIIESLKKLFTDKIKVVLIPEITRGAAETALAAAGCVDTNEELIISDTDHHFDGKYLYKTILEKEEDIAGVIPVFRPRTQEPKWSYSLFNKDYIISAVGEKDAELLAKGAYANIGGYYFTKAKTFFNEVKNMIQAGDMYGAPGKMEFYVAPVYDRLIKKGMKIKAAITPRVWGLGTPDDVDYFEKYFKDKKTKKKGKSHKKI